MCAKPGTLYLVDGTALAYRSYFAFIKNPLVNARGETTSAAYGVTTALTGLIRDHAPAYLAVAFDTGKPTFRHEMYDKYKATRQKMPDDMVDQLPRVRQAVEALGITIIERNGVEADDVIGTLAVRGEAAGLDVCMVTGDKDFMQLITGHICLYNPSKNELLRVADVVAKAGVPPGRIVDLMGLMGDASDNVPGVPKVGAKTALALIEQFGTLDAVLDRADEIAKPSIRASVTEHREQALLSRRLVTIKTDVDLDVTLDDLRYGGIPTETARAFFREMEFTRLLDDVREADTAPEREATVVTPATLEAFFADVAHARELAFDLETTSLDTMRAEIVGISLASAEGVWYLPVGHAEGENLDRAALWPRLKHILEDPAVAKIGHNAKYDSIILRRNNITPAPLAHDTMLAAYVLDPGARSYSLATLSGEQLNHPMQSITELIGTGKKQRSFAEVDIAAAARYSGDDAATTYRLKETFAPRIEREGLGGLYTGIEMPLVAVLMAMEMHGVLLDVPLLAEISEEFAGKMSALEAEIYELAGEMFNINSPKQLGEILFTGLGLRTRRKTKTGFSTDIDTLSALAHEHPLPAKILDYRQITKLKSTYVDALPAMINPATGRVHTSYNQAVTATGRLSSSDPNLQNIPIRTEMGRVIRRAFIAPPGHVILSADYSQIELRIMAHMSGDPVLRDAFAHGEDVHRRTASVLFNTFPEMVSDDQRRQAKTINFGVMYGMGAYSLSEQLGIGRAEAKAFIDAYFAAHTGVRDFIETTIAEATKTGYVTTLLGRRRYVPDITSTNHNMAEFAKRTAVNTPIQGSAADLIKKAMIDLDARLRESDPDSRMIMQVHDELVLEVPEGRVETVTALVKETMEGAMALSVPLVVDISTGPDWLTAH